MSVVYFSYFFLQLDSPFQFPFPFFQQRQGELGSGIPSSLPTQTPGSIAVTSILRTAEYMHALHWAKFIPGVLPSI